MSQKKNLISENNLLTVIPFLLTASFIFIGYQILTSTTPEAKIAPNIQQAQAEIISDQDFELVKPKTPIPQELNLYLSQVPDKQIQLDQVIEGAKNANTNGIYFYLPVTIKEDLTLEPANVHQTNINNIINWVKKSASTAHTNELQVVFALTYNASTTISDLPTFTKNLEDFLPRWAGLSNEVSISFFNPGITIGHPLYSNLTDLQVTQLLADIQKTVRKNYSGRIGVSFCCQTQSTVSPAGYSFVVAVPTPEFTQADLAPQVLKFQAIHDFKHALVYDRENKRVVSLTN